MRILALFAVGAMALGGCFVSPAPSDPVVVPNPPPADGSLVIDWTINGTKDPNQCVQGQASSIEITVYAAGDGVGTAYTQSCESLATSITLIDGDYSATAWLADSSGRARTTMVDLAPFRIVEGTELTIPIDFPADSFVQ